VLSNPIFNSVLDRYEKIYVIVSPPRCSSTAFARVFWRHPTIRYYAHEPFEVTYYNDAPLEEVVDKLLDPLDLKLVQREELIQPPEGLVIKEMPYQAGEHFPLLASMATGPIIFLIRDPRLNITSRIAKKVEVGDNPIYPFIESGWELLAQQIEYCRHADIPYRIVDATEFRNQPETIFSQVFAQHNLNFSPTMLKWKSRPKMSIDNLSGVHTHLYQRVLTSVGIQPAIEPIPPLESFPDSNGLRAHVAECLKIYAALRSEPNRIILDSN